MPPRPRWTRAERAELHRLRAAGLTWPQVAAAVSTCTRPRSPTSCRVAAARHLVSQENA
jgi:hypothetical protein